jgi:N-acetylneuraminate lyase
MDHNEAFSSITGLIAAPPTAFTTDGNLDLEAVKPLAEHLCSEGVSGVFVNGTTGEGNLLDSAERKCLVEKWREVLPNTLKLIVHVGYVHQEEGQKLAKHAQTVGADAIGGMPPASASLKENGIDGVVEWCSAVAAAVPKMPFYLYYMPVMNNIRFSVARFLERCDTRIPNLAGVKYTCETLGDFLEAKHVCNGRYDLLWGRDEMLLAALSIGAEGAVGSTYNMNAPLYLKLIDAFKQGDLESARDLQLQSIQAINKLIDTGSFFSAIKSELQDQGVPISPVVRPCHAS